MPYKERRRRLRWLREFWSLAKPYWTSEERWRASGYLFWIVAITLSIVYLSVQLNQWYQQFYDIAAPSTPAATYYKALLKYCWIAGIWITIDRVSSYLKYRLRLSWREWMSIGHREDGKKFHERSFEVPAKVASDVASPVGVAVLEEAD